MPGEFDPACMVDVSLSGELISVNEVADACGPVLAPPDKGLGPPTAPVTLRASAVCALLSSNWLERSGPFVGSIKLMIVAAGAVGTCRRRKGFSHAVWQA